MRRRRFSRGRRSYRVFSGRRRRGAAGRRIGYRM